MSGNPVNLAFRFLLELAALASVAYWGWTQHQGIWKALAAVLAVLVLAGAWGTLRVPGDPGDAPVAVPGIVRLLIEAAVFAAALWALAAADRPTWAMAFAALLALHYALSYDRLLWLLRH